MAAGQGFKTFTTGEVLTAADVNGYLMQGILVFASEAARDAAITSPQEGQFAFTKDNNSLWYYTGSAWAASGAAGDIEGVTAGVGISGGGTSGTVTITNSMATAIDAKGDLVVGTGADTFAKLTVGTNGYTLVADSAETTGLKWQAPAGGGFSSFTDYTPTFTNFTLGNGSVVAQYATSGSLVWYQGRITIGSTSSFSGNLRVSLPYQITTTFADGFYYPMLSVGSGWDSSASVVKVATVRCATSSTLSLTSLDTNTAWATAQPWSWATDDRINFQVMYRSSEL